MLLNRVRSVPGSYPTDALGFVVNKVALEQDLLPVVQFILSTISIIWIFPLFHHIFLAFRMKITCS